MRTRLRTRGIAMPAILAGLLCAFTVQTIAQQVNVEFDNKIGGQSAGGKIHVYYDQQNWEEDVPFNLEFPPSATITMWTVQDRLQTDHKPGIFMLVLQGSDGVATRMIIAR